MSKRIFVTGGSGFVGSAVLQELVHRNYDVAALEGKRPLDTHGGAVRAVKGDLFNARSLDAGLAGCDAVIHLVGIIMENRSKGVTFERIHHQGTKAIVDATIRNNIKRYIHMSALGTRLDAVSNYHKTKFKAEQYVRASGLDWTIFRPSLIHGPKGEFMRMEAKWARKQAPPFLFMPYFGTGAFGRGGAGKLQPVYVNDVARAFVDAIEKPQTIGEIYPLAGPEMLTWPELHRVVAGAVANKPHRWAMGVPVWYAKLLTHIAPAALLPFNHDQVVMSQEDNTADITKMRDHFGWEPAGFEATLKSYASQM